jgi:glycosyltransferase involved in cell wall biosynthesis
MKKPPRVLLLVDWVPERGSLLLESLRKAGLDCDIMGINFHQSKWTPVSKIFSHWPRCLWVSLKAFCRRNDYDYIIVWQQVMGMFLGLLKLVTFSNSPSVFILTAVIVERSNPVLEQLRRWFIAASWKRVNKIGFMSNAYKSLIQERFKLSEAQSIHLPFPLVFEKNPDFSGFKPNSYLYSVGLSYRDFPTLMEVAKKSSKKFVVATTDAFLKDSTIPENVTVYRNSFGKAADELMEQSAAVILTLDRTSSPAAEATLINAMCYGKPVIVTRTITIQEYIEDGKNGFLVPWKDSDAIVDAINIIFSHPDKAEKIGRRARQSVLENHSMDLYANKVAHVIQNSLLETRRL